VLIIENGNEKSRHTKVERMDVVKMFGAKVCCIAQVQLRHINGTDLATSSFGSSNKCC
jgi:hypothetical protein